MFGYNRFHFFFLLIIINNIIYYIPHVPVCSYNCYTMVKFLNLERARIMYKIFKYISFHKRTVILEHRYYIDMGIDLVPFSEVDGIDIHTKNHIK